MELGENQPSVYFVAIVYSFFFQPCFLPALSGGGTQGPSVDFASAYEESDLRSSNLSRLQSLEASVEHRNSSRKNSIDADLDSAREYATSFFYTLVTMLRFRAMADFKNPEFIIARIADKLLTAFVIATLYGGLGNNAGEGFDLIYIFRGSVN